jgi:acetylornithine deacetylase/succinyl-diaminopimelate desuccinylase-like protein
MIKKLISACFYFAIACSATAQTSSTEIIKKFVSDNTNNIISDFSLFLAIPNVAAKPMSLKTNADVISDMMTTFGIADVQLLYANDSSTPPAVYGEIKTPGATKTLAFYAHYDGQPVNPEQWAKELEPFVPRLFTDALDKGGKNIPFIDDNNYDENWRIYARGSSDDKAGVMAILNAYNAIKKSGLSLSYNLKFFFEGEEEAGSPHLHEIFTNYKSLLAADLWIICDGPVHQSGKKQIVFGVRGDTHLDLTVYASKRPLHSGHYGNWAPNPAMMLAKLLSSMKDDRGRVTIKDFYNDVIPLSASEKKALKEVPPVDEQMKRELGIKDAEMPGTSLSDAINLPSLNINGFQSGNVGKQASNQIPTYATAVIDLRLVLGNDYKRQQQKVIEHIKSQGYFVIDHEPTDEERKSHAKIIKVIPGNDGVNAQRTSMDLPIVKKLVQAIKTTTTGTIVLQPTLGGTLPLYLFEKILKAKTITVPIANHDNNQHAENENIRLGNFFDGIKIYSALMLIK